MAEKIIITCAVTGSAPTPDMNPAVPVTPDEIAASALEAHDAGAAIVHLHARDPATKQPSLDPAYYRAATERIRASCSGVVINLTTGPGASFVPGDENPADGTAKSVFVLPEIRVQHVAELRPEICSLDIATMNRPNRVFLNTRDHLTEMAKRINALGVKPELEVFDLGHIELARHLLDEGILDSPPLFQLCLGTAFGAPAKIETLVHMRDQLPTDATWAAFGISRWEMPIVAAAIQLGGHVRVGLEDNIYLERGVLAPSNAALVEKAVRIIRLLGYEVASSDEARKILGLPVQTPVQSKATAAE
jgi:uncharacterized protein (DUF849 family)